MKNWLRKNAERLIFITAIGMVGSGIAINSFIGAGIAAAGAIIIIDLYIPGKKQ